jgi:DNA-binding transcriptional ArsR family regulator
MLYCLMDGRARTSSELAIVAQVSPSTASVHLHRLATERLVSQVAQGKHRYYTLAGPRVAGVLESLSVLAGGRSTAHFRPSTPDPLRFARTCYDHLAGTAGVALHDRLHELDYLRDCSLTAAGRQALTRLGLDLAAIAQTRRRFAYPCLDWSERRPHLAGALGAALLNLGLTRNWFWRHLDSRALDLTAQGRRQLQSCLGIRL